ncbi:MAG: glycosyltransferase family 2 protein [Nitrospirales bacterium]
MKESFQPSISIVIPAFDEENGIGPQIETIRKALQSYHGLFEIVVIDDGSADKTAEQARKAGARVLCHQKNRGYGAALKTGIRLAEHDIIVITDADGTYPADQIPNIVAQLENADMVVGARVGSTVHIPLIRQPAKWVLRKLAAHIAGQPIPDLNSGLRAFRRNVITQYYSLLSNRFSFTTTSTLAFLGDDYRVVYHPINYYKRTGQSKIRPKHFMEFMILVLRMAMLFQPLKVFIPLACVFGLGGLLKLFFDVSLFFQRTTAFEWASLYNPILSTSTLLLLLGALQLLLVGMVADGILRRVTQHNRPEVLSSSLQPYEHQLSEELTKISGQKTPQTLTKLGE